MSKQSIAYSQIPASKGFYGLLLGLAVVMGIGALAFFFMEHTGHYVTGMNNQVVWGLPHVFAIFMIVAASGALNVGSIGTVFGKTIYQPMGRLSALLAISLLLGGLSVLVLDLGRPDRLIVAMTHYNFKSIFAWNIILYNGFLVLTAIYIWTMMDRQLKPYYKIAGFAAFSWRLILTMGTGSIFGFIVARQYYDSAIMAPLFVAMSFSFGLAVFILTLYATYTVNKRPLGQVVLNRLRYLLAIFIGAVLVLELARHLYNLYATQRHGVEAFILKEGGFYTFLFWGGQVFLGGLLPLFFIFCRKFANQTWALLAAAKFVILGGFMQLYVLLIGGQVYPLRLFPNAELKSSFFDGQIASYSPSLWEWMLGIGGVAVAASIVIIGMRVLRFLPTSLADKAVDPHQR